MLLILFQTFLKAIVTFYLLWLKISMFLLFHIIISLTIARLFVEKFVLNVFSRCLLLAQKGLHIVFAVLNTRMLRRIHYIILMTSLTLNRTYFLCFTKMIMLGSCTISALLFFPFALLVLNNLSRTYI